MSRLLHHFVLGMLSGCVQVNWEKNGKIMTCCQFCIDKGLTKYMLVNILLYNTVELW